MREIVLDTETTGFSPASGDRIVEIGCVELWNRAPTGKYYQQYINPERDMPVRALNVHGLSGEFLRGYPNFSGVVEDFLTFVGDSNLVIHNAGFDMRFINAELEWLGWPSLPMSRVTDTVSLARRKYPDSKATLDALCQRFGIDNSARTTHGALLDAQILSEIYVEIIRQRW